MPRRRKKIKPAIKAKVLELSKGHGAKAIASVLPISLSSVYKILREPQHLTELSITALMLAENLSRYRNESATFLGFPNKVGNAIYGEPSAATQLARLQEVDKPTALNLLSHLREEFPEVDDITDWANLTDDKITENLIKRLTLKGNRGDFKGNCSGCPH